MKRTAFLSGSALLLLLSSGTALAQQTLEDRVRALEQKLGVPPEMPGDNRSLEQRVKAIEDALAQKDEQKEADEQAIRTRVSTLEQQVAETTVSIDNSRPTIASADGRFTFSLRARIQFDSGLFNQDSNLNATNVQFKDLASGSVVRRFYFGGEGRAFRDFWYEFRMDLGGAGAAEGTNSTVNLARIAYNWGDLTNPTATHFRINAGIIQPLFTYGDGISSGSAPLLEEADVVNTAIGGYGGADHRRGIELTFQQQDIFQPGDNLVLSTAYTGQQTPATGGAGTNTTDEGTQIVGRAVYRFWSDGFSNFQFGGNFAHIFNMTGTSTPGGARSVALQDRPEIRIDGNRLVSTVNSTLLGASTSAVNLPERGGTLWGLEGGGNWRNFYLYGEYMQFGMNRDVMCTGCTPFGGTPGVNPGDPHFHGWYAEGSWVLTGESRTYQTYATNNEFAIFNNPRVVTPFDLRSGSWGAWEVAARYSDLDLNWNPGQVGQTAAQAPVGGVRGGEERIWTLGLNWYMNNNVLMRFNYLIVDVNKLGFVTSAGATTLQEIGQNFTAMGVRLQFTN